MNVKVTRNTGIPIHYQLVMLGEPTICNLPADGYSGVNRILTHLLEVLNNLGASIEVREPRYKAFNLDDAAVSVKSQTLFKAPSVFRIVLAYGFGALVAAQNHELINADLVVLINPWSDVPRSLREWKVKGFTFGRQRFYSPSVGGVIRLTKKEALALQQVNVSSLYQNAFPSTGSVPVLQLRAGDHVESLDALAKDLPKVLGYPYMDMWKIPAWENHQPWVEIFNKHVLAA